jgi:hypothetical protein
MFGMGIGLQWRGAQLRFKDGEFTKAYGRSNDTGERVKEKSNAGGDAGKEPTRLICWWLGGASIMAAQHWLLGLPRRLGAEIAPVQRPVRPRLSPKLEPLYLRLSRYHPETDYSPYKVQQLPSHVPGGFYL